MTLSALWSEAGEQVKTYVERSILVPDHVMSSLMLPRLKELGNHSWLLDGEKNTALISITKAFFLLYSRSTLSSMSNSSLTFFWSGFPTADRYLPPPRCHLRNSHIGYYVESRPPGKSFFTYYACGVSFYRV